MIVVMKPGHSPKELEHVIRVMEEGGVNVMISRGTETTILGAEGDASRVDSTRISHMPGVDNVVRISLPKNRPIQPETPRIVAVVGLGLIGGSLAAALRGFPGWSVVGIVRRQKTAEYAMVHDICDQVTMDPSQVLPQADVTFLCMSPAGIVDFLQEYRESFRAGSLVCDVSGIKTAIMKAAEVLPDNVDFIGCHPMAGTEFSGIENSFSTLFQQSHFIVTPRKESSPVHLELLRRMADYIGCRDLVRTDPEEHDSIIAYTSQMMHIIALAVCDDPELFRCRGFEGGSFRDCTRVAALDVPLWTELFSMNAPALSRVLERLEQNIRAYRKVLEQGDVDALREKLQVSSQRKREMNLPGPGQVLL